MISSTDRAADPINCIQSKLFKAGLPLDEGTVAKTSGRAHTFSIFYKVVRQNSTAKTLSSGVLTK